MSAIEFVQSMVPERLYSVGSVMIQIEMAVWKPDEERRIIWQWLMLKITNGDKQNG